MALANEYEKLLRYLEKQEPRKGASNTSPSAKPKKEPTKKELASQNTKKLLEEATIDDFTDLPTVHINKGNQSKSFDVIKFENLMRSKLIEEYKTLPRGQEALDDREVYNYLAWSSDRVEQMHEAVLSGAINSDNVTSDLAREMYYSYPSLLSMHGREPVLKTICC